MSQADRDRELGLLLQEMNTMARDLVEKAGGSPAFGGTINDQGQVGLVFDQTAITGGATVETANKLLEAVRREARAANIRAAAVANMGYVNDPETNRQTTAVVISLHHRTGRNVDHVTPFSKGASGAIRFGKPITGLSKTKLF